MSHRIRLTIAAASVLSASWLGTARSQPCEDSLTIDTLTVAIPDQWCSRELADSMKADPQTLLRLPDSLCFEDYRIYVTDRAYRAFTSMAAAARGDGVQLITDSGFRSASFQKRIILRRLAAGESILSLLEHVAPPGYSEHQTGRALDLVPSEARFAHTSAYRWLQSHAKTYGFVESFPQDRPDNLAWEPWHWLYVDSIAVKSASDAGDDDL